MLQEHNAVTSSARPIIAAEPVLVRCEKLTKSFRQGSDVVQVLNGVALEIRAGAYEALMGPSGSGKTTLLNLIAGLETPSAGRVVFDGADLSRLGDRARARWRANNVGIVFQSYNLFPVLTALQNVELPLLLTPVSARERRKRAETALRMVGLSERTRHKPAQLSGGQQQRVAIARAIVTDPKLIIADEPTGDLDRKSADDILDLLDSLHRELGKTIVMVTHDPLAAKRAQRIRQIDKGQLR